MEAGVRRIVALLAPLSLSLHCDVIAQSKGGVHAHTAPFDTAPFDTAPFDTAPLPGGYLPNPTPLFNFPNGAWDNGEGFEAGVDPANQADHGGYHGADDAAMTLDFVHTRRPWHDFTTPDNRTVKRFVGHLGPSSAPLGAPVPDAGFELFAADPSLFLVGKPIAIVITTFATLTPPPIQFGGTSVYPGMNPDGLIPAEFKLGDILSTDPNRVFRPSPISWDVVADGIEDGDYNVIAGYVVPRTTPRPMVFQGQRNRQLARAIQLLLQDSGPMHPPGFPVLAPDADVACVIAGGSFGGVSSHACLVAYPGEFDAALIASMAPSMRRLVDEHQSYVYTTTRLGFGTSGTAYNIRDTLEISAFMRQFEAFADPTYTPASDFYNFSLSAASCRQGMGAPRFARHAPRHSAALRIILASNTGVQRRAEQLPFPLSFVIGDEDTVSTGNDWLPAFTGVRAYTDHGLFGGVPPAVTAVTVMNKRCHYRGAHTTGVLGQSADDLTPSTLELLPFADLAHWANPPTGKPLPQVDPDPPADLDVHQHALGRAAPPVAATGPLELDSDFGAGFGFGAGRTSGDGLTLGWDESLAVDGEDIWDGSADGVVTRFHLDEAAGTLLPAARSAVLGYGAFALEVADLDTGSDNGLEIVVGTQRHLHVLHADTLQPVNSRLLPYRHSRPRRMAIGDLFGDGDPEILFTTFLGHVVAVDADLDVLCDLPEPGVQDLLISSESHPGATSDSKRLVTLLSRRGHLINVTLNEESIPDDHLGAAPCALVQSVSELQLGNPADLELFDDNGTPKVAALFASQSLPGFFGNPPDQPSINRTYPIGTFHAGSLAFDGQADVKLYEGGLDTRAQQNLDLEVVHDTQGQEHYLFIGAGLITLVTPSSTPGLDPTEHRVSLRTDPATMEAVALEVAELLDPVDGEQFTQDIIVSTATGRVSVFRLQDVVDSDQGYIEFHDLFTNETLAGTWGLAVGTTTTGSQEVELQVLNQCGERFEVDPVTGAATRLHVMRRNNRPLPNILRSWEPLTRTRSLVHVPWNPTSTPFTAADLDLFTSLPPAFSQPAIPGWAVSTNPWQNYLGQPLSPEWRKGGYTPDDATLRPILSVYDGWATPGLGGDLLAIDPPGTAPELHLQWWGGHAGFAPPSDSAWIQSSVMQGLVLENDSGTASIASHWYSTEDTGNSPAYGRQAGECKDLRNNVQDYLPINNLHSLRMVEDSGQPLIFACTSGGSVIALRPGSNTGAITDHGTILAETDIELPLDDGYGAMALAVRPSDAAAPDAAFDLFVGVSWHHLDPAPFATGQPAPLAGAVRHLRWTSSGNGSFSSPGGLLVLDPTSGDRGGYTVSGCAVGDLLEASIHDGDELVVTTLDGDLFIYGIDDNGFTSAPLFRTEVPGSIGAFDSILIADLDANAPGAELYVGGSLGIRKWVRSSTGGN